MPLRSEDMPGPDHVEQMTAAPGETRDVAAKVLVPWYRDDAGSLMGYRDRSDLDGFEGQKRWIEASSIVPGGDGSAWAGTLVSGEMPPGNFGGWTEREDLAGFDGRARWWQCSNGCTPMFHSATAAEGYPFAGYPISSPGSTTSRAELIVSDWSTDGE